MSLLDRNTEDLRAIVEDILYQFRKFDAAKTAGPHEALSCQELRLVEYLGDNGPRMMRELADFLVLAVNSVTNTVDNLEKKGIVRRVRSEEDRRIVRVELTPAGQEVAAAAMGEKRQLMRCILGAMNEDEQAIFLVLFRKAARAGWNQVRKIAPSA